MSEGAQPQGGDIAARYEIERVLVRCAFALDDRDWDALATCFAENAFANFGPDFSAIDGRDEIVALCRRLLTPLDASQHLLGTIEVTAQERRARSRCYFQAQHIRAEAPGGALYIIAGSYHDRFVHERGLWKIQRRELRASWTDGNPAVLSN